MGSNPFLEANVACLAIHIKLSVQWTYHHCCSQWWLFSVLWCADCCADIWQMMCHHRWVVTHPDTNSTTVTWLSPCHAVNMVSCPPRLCLRRWNKSSIPQRVISHRAIGKYTQVQSCSIWLQFLNNWIYTLIDKGSLELNCVFQTGVSIVLSLSDTAFK